MTINVQPHKISDDERKLWKKEAELTSPIKNKKKSQKNAQNLGIEIKNKNTFAASKKIKIKKSNTFHLLSQKFTREDFENLLSQTDLKIKTEKQKTHFLADKLTEAMPSHAKRAYIPTTVYPSPQVFDTRLKAKIAKGHTPLEERIDLHGMTQQAAFSALQVFIQAAHQRGARNVLVITGKGKADKPYTIKNTFEHGEVGVLRRQVPQWLKLPSLRGYIQMIDCASQIHGGEGALYVRLRRSKV